MATEADRMRGQPDSWDAAREILAHWRHASVEMGGAEAIQRQHDKGRRTPRERIDLLLDRDSFREVGELAVGTVLVPGRPPRDAPADGVVTGWGTVGGRRVVVIADDGTIAAGARGHAANRKAALVATLAKSHGLPLVWFAEASVNRMQHVMGSQFAGALERDLGVAFSLRSVGSGRVSPTIVAVSGQAVGAPSFTAVAAEFTTIVRGSASMALAGPSIVRAAVGDDITSEELGGADVHARETGFVDWAADSEAEAADAITRFLSYLPSNSECEPPRRGGTDPGSRECPEVTEIVPLEYRRAYDMRRVARAIVDDHDVLEVKSEHARNIVCAYARIDGWAVGIVANNPLYKAGVVDSASLRKAARFVQVCNTYNLPIVFLQDQPGVMVGPDAERDGVIREVTRATKAMRSLRVPVLTVLIRKCYGFSYLLLGGRQSAGGDCVVAWPSAAVSLAGPEAGVATVLAREERAGTLTDERRAQVLHDYIDDARARYAAIDGRIDDIIDPAHTRPFLARQLGVFARRGPSGRLGPRVPLDA